MTNQEKKQELWEKLKGNYSHLENYCKIELQGMEDENIYFHPTFVIDSATKITSQADINTNKFIYATRFSTKDFNIDIYEGLVSNIIIGYHANKEQVILALNTLFKVREHARQIENYTNEYISNILVGNSIKEITNSFINELKTTSQLVEFMQKSKSLEN
jgi:hypothetical protein